MSWRDRLGCCAAWFVLVVTVAAALEVYDETPPSDGDGEVVYQEDNDIDTGPSVPQQQPDEPVDSARTRELLLYKLIKTMRLRDATHPTLYYRPFWSAKDDKTYRSVSHNNYLPDKVDAKETIVKRISNAIRGSRTFLGLKPLDRVVRPQQKWKIKKGKAIGSQMVCYFKLCAFRSPA